DPESFAGGDEAGKYTIDFEYTTADTANIARDLGVADYWTGRLARITLVYRHPQDARRELPLPNKVINAGLNPKDPRILAFVAYLDKNGMTAVHNEASGYWHISRPAAPDGAYVVSIRTFPEDASEKQMRMALQTINLAYKLNAPARIAMSYVGGHGT